LFCNEKADEKTRLTCSFLVTILRLLNSGIYFMKVITDSVNISTQGNTDIIDVTRQVEGILHKTGLKEGNLSVFVSGSTAELHP